jgi:ABC-type lipoprotein export system ATPase subunit
MVTHDTRFSRQATRSVHLFDGRIVDERMTADLTH